MFLQTNFNEFDGIGLTLKIITGQLKKVQLFVSGSSSFDLGKKLNEPLTGRKWEYELFPISWEELEKKEGFVKSVQQIENRLLFGLRSKRSPLFSMSPKCKALPCFYGN